MPNVSAANPDKLCCQRKKLCQLGHTALSPLQCLTLGALPPPLQEEQKGTLDYELAAVISSIALACKQIASLVQRAGISNLMGLAGEQNVQGEDQKKLDVVSNEVFCNCLRQTGRTVRRANP